MFTPHINAKKNDFSDIMIMSGDPLRALYIAKNFLKNSYQVNNIRGMLGFTGIYKNRKVSVMGHGIGIPSCLIYIKELIDFFGIKIILRLGSCGAINKKIKLRDIIIAMGACTDSKINRQNFLDNDFSAIADYELMKNAIIVAKKNKINFHVGNVFTTDIFYRENIKFYEKIEKFGILAIEMETSGIYSISAQYKNVQSLSICTVSDHIKTGECINALDRENSFNTMIKIGLESILLI
ncbi:MAG: purine-nucleoside phosphorylase [Arsenophonus sp.]|nr:MAG: purine-nucleoside phosphorylase [Arsenophonus sp.]